MDERLNCKGCIECCHWLTFIIQPDPAQFANYMEFYKARGCKVEMIGGGRVGITVPSPCPQLSTFGCKIHAESPAMCKSYDCRTDIFLKAGKYYKASGSGNQK